MAIHQVATLIYSGMYHGKNPVPSWSGWMQLCYEKQTNGSFDKSSIFFLPIIDISPSDMSCILSTLKYLSDNNNNNTGFTHRNLPTHVNG